MQQPERVLNSYELCNSEVMRHCGQVYTYGSPRPGNRAFKQEYDKMVPDTWNCINDAVSPPAAIAATSPLFAPTDAATKPPYVALPIPSSAVPLAGQIFCFSL